MAKKMASLGLMGVIPVLIVLAIFAEAASGSDGLLDLPGRSTSMAANMPLVDSAAVEVTPAITVTEVISSGAGLVRPTDIANAGDGRLFIVEKAGTIRIFDGSTVLATPFLDISSLVATSLSDNDERGLLGLAFHPNYASNGYFYVNYTTGGDLISRIARYTVSGNANVADPASAQTILEFDQPANNHNSGDLNFGPNDGYLYINVGDGGGGGDPSNLAQNNGQLLGKILRIDVDGSGGAECDSSGFNNYAIPTNPFSDGAGSNCDEIWSTGLRNPWRASFDRKTADLWLGDVGQGDWEEVDFQAANSTDAKNWGWRCYEGNHTYNTTGCGPMADYDFPVFEYSSGSGSGNCSITGGFVYRGAAVPALEGHYLFADYCSNRFWSLSGSLHTPTYYGLANVQGAAVSRITTFGEGANGELYLAENGSNASVFEVTGAALLPDTVLDIALPAGWRMISSNVDPDNWDLATLLGGINEIVLLKNGDGDVYWPALEIDDIDKWDVREGYQVYLSDPALLSFTGQAVNPAQAPIDLPAGWSLVSYLRDSALPVDQALDSISVELLLAKNGLGEVYWPDYGINQIGDMEQGEGYQVFLDQIGTLIYPD